MCVVGTSRGGTSLTARVLDLAGVYFGSEEDLLGGELAHIPDESRQKARTANPEGFWEHYRLMRLNERILRRFGGNWREPPSLEAGWEESAELEPEREEALGLIEETFAGHRLWGWKDPRNSLTLPFWRRLLPQVRCVVCLRYPFDVALSLERRDGLPVERGLDLWLAYVAASFVNTAGVRRVVVPYEAYFDDPLGVAGRLARFAGRDDVFASADAGAQLGEAVDRRLWRQRTAVEGGGERRLPDRVATLHRAVESLAATAPEAAGPRGRELHAEVDRLASSLYGVREPS